MSVCEYSFPDEKTYGKALVTAWSCAEKPVLAVATDSGYVLFVTPQGQLLDNSAKLKRKGECTALAWHPVSPDLLALGWEDGSVSLWRQQGKQRTMREDNLTHSAAISVLHWTPNGRRFISGDQSGGVTVWGAAKDSTSGMGELLAINKYERSQGAIRLVSFSSHHQAKVASFYFAGEDGNVYFGDDRGNSSEVLTTPGPIQAMIYVPAGKSGTLWVLCHGTRKTKLCQYVLTERGYIKAEHEYSLELGEEDSKNNSGNPPTAEQVVFIGNKGQEAVCGVVTSGGKAIRVLNLYNMGRAASYDLNVPQGEVITSICFEQRPQRQQLVAGCQSGKTYIWGFKGVPTNHITVASDWTLQESPLQAKPGVRTICPAPRGGAMTILADMGGCIQNEVRMAAVASSPTDGVLQLSEREVYVVRDGKASRVKTTVRIDGLCYSSPYLLVFDGTQAELWDTKEGIPTNMGVFPTEAMMGTMMGPSVFVGAHDYIIETSTLRGAVKVTLSFSDKEGRVEALDARDGFVAAASDKGVLKLWKLMQEGEAGLPSLVFPARVLPELAGLRVTLVAINATGTKVAMLAHSPAKQAQDSHLFVFDVNLDKIQSFDCGPAYLPVFVGWDASDERLLVMETMKNPSSISSGAAHAAGPSALVGVSMDGIRDTAKKSQRDVDFSFQEQLASREVNVLFVSSDHGILVQDVFRIDSRTQSLIGVSLPHILLAQRPRAEDEAAGVALGLESKTVSDFVGLEKENGETLKHVAEFSFYLTIGDIKEAFNAVKGMSSESVWNNMARRCVKTRRLDVALQCLAQTGNASGAQALRTAMKEEHEPQVQAAMLAIQVGMEEEAEKLYRASRRHDLLGNLYQAKGRYEDALQLCEKHDRIHLRNTHYKFARHLEQVGEVRQAVKHYQQAIGHEADVPRMLLDTQPRHEIENFLRQSNEPEFYTWYGKYLESLGDKAGAKRYYVEADDTENQARLLLADGQEKEAIELVTESADPAACLYLATQLELAEPVKVQEAIELYALAKMHTHALRLVKQHGLDSKLEELVEQSDEATKLDAARHFESKGSYDKAIRLYRKGKAYKRAIELSFEQKITDELDAIAEVLDPASVDPPLLGKLAQYFQTFAHYQRAVQLYVAAQMPNEALDLVINFSIPLTEELVEAMTPEKGTTPKAKKTRLEVLSRLGEACLTQGMHSLACKKFTQAKDMVKGIQSLLETKDAEKITAYANMAKKPQVYLMAADWFFENSDWMMDTSLQDTIVAFYAKAKAVEALADFFERKGQMEINDYSQYDKAAQCLVDAIRYLSKGEPPNQARITELEEKLAITEKFVQVRALAKLAAGETPGEGNKETNLKYEDQMIHLCDELVGEEMEATIRVGDVYGVLFEYYHGIGEFEDAWNILVQMRDKGIAETSFVDDELVAEVQQRLFPQGAPTPTAQTSTSPSPTHA